MISQLWQLYLTTFSSIMESPIWTTATRLALAFEIAFIVCGCAVLAALARRSAEEMRGWPGHGGSPLASPDLAGPEDWFVWPPAWE
jgi:hypothetical protein